MRSFSKSCLNYCVSTFTFAESLNVSKIKISIVEENTQLRKWYESYGFIHVKTVKYDFFPFTCGYMEKHIQQDTR